MENSTERHQEKIVDAFVSKVVYGACLVTTTLLIHRSRAGKVIEGYLVFDDMKSYLCHYWCSIDEINRDLGSIINKRLGNNIFEGCLLQIPPIGYQYVSKMDKKSLRLDFAATQPKLKSIGKRHRDGFEHWRIRDFRKLYIIVNKYIILLTQLLHLLYILIVYTMDTSWVSYGIYCQLGELWEFLLL